MQDGKLVEVKELPADDAPEPAKADADGVGGVSAEDLEPTIILGRE